MKTLNSPMNISALIAIVASMLIFYSCNSLHGDPDLVKKSGDEIYLTASGTSVIDLKSRIKTSGATTIAISSQPIFGTAQAFGEGFANYRPTILNKSQRDAFVIKAFDSNQVLLETDTVIVVVESDSTLLPCSVYANPDYAYDVLGAGGQTYVNVRYNDIICSGDSSDFIITIASAPRYGTADIFENRFVHYTAASVPTAPGDSLIYKIQSASNPSHYAYGLVTIRTQGQCMWNSVQDDFFFLNVDSLLQATHTDTLSLRVFDNDGMCPQTLPYTVNILQPFANGITVNALASTRSILFQPDSLPSPVDRFDTMRYEVCNAGACYQARVVIEMVRP